MKNTDKLINEHAHNVKKSTQEEIQRAYDELLPLLLAPLPTRPRKVKDRKVKLDHRSYKEQYGHEFEFPDFDYYPQ